jgi:glycosyltransferase involved in cell wall biosynthesis
MKPSGVCMITTGFYPRIGGSEKQVELLSKWLVQQGIPVLIVTREVDGVPMHEAIHGAEVYRVPVLKGKGLSALSFLIGGVALLLRRRRQFNLIHSHQIYTPTTIGWIVTRLLRYPLLSHMQLGGPEGDILKLLRHGVSGRIRLEILKRTVTTFISVSRQIDEELEEAGVPAAKVFALPNTVDTETFSPAAPETHAALRLKLGLPAHVPIVVYIGRLVEIKGLDVLLQAWASMPVEAHLVIVGDGPHAEALRQQAAPYGDRIIFTGIQHNTADYLRASDIWTLPSYGEGLSVSLLEAMACALPVVTTPVGEIPYVIQHEQNGLLVPPGDAHALAAALRFVIEHPAEAQAMGQRARETVVGRYGLEYIGREYLNLLTRIGS